MKNKHRAVSTIVGTFFFLVLMLGAFSAITVFLQAQTETQNVELDVTNQQVWRIHEEFKFEDEPGGVCIDPANNRLFVEVENIGINAIEFADLWILNQTLTSQPANLYDINYTDAFVPFGHNASLLLDQPLYLDGGHYQVKLVTTLGTMHIYPEDGSGIYAPYPEASGGYLGDFATNSGVCDLTKPEGLEFGPDGNLYVADEGTHKILRYDGTTGACIDVFADLSGSSGGGSSSSSGGGGGGSSSGDASGGVSGGGSSSCKKPLGIEFGPDGHLYVASESKDVVCKINGSTGDFVEYFVTEDLGGLDEPSDVTFGSDGNLYVSSTDTDQVLRYDGTSGAFIDVFVSAGSGSLDKPKYLEFEGNYLYVSSIGTDQVLRYDSTTGTFDSAFVTAGLGGLDEPEGIRFDTTNSNFYVSSEKTDEIIQYDLSGNLLKTFVTAGSGGLDEPADLVIGPDGNLYVSGEKSNAVHKYSAKVVLPGAVASCDGFTCANGCPAAPSAGAGAGDFFVSSDSTDEVLRYSNSTGAFVEVFVTAGLGGLDSPADLVFGPVDGNLYVSSEDSDEILKYDGDTGSFINAFVSSGSGGLDGPEGLVFGSDGHLYVASEQSHQILKYNGNTGAFIEEFADLNPSSGSSTSSGGGAGSGSTCKKPLGMEFGPDGHLYVASEDKDVVCRYNGSTGAMIDYFVSDGLGGLNHPADVTFGPDGHLYVTGEDSNKVYRYNGSTGAFIDVYSSTGLAKPKFLMFDAAGRLLVSSEENDKVVRYVVTTGAFDTNFVDPSDNGGLDKPQGITFKP